MDLKLIGDNGQASTHSASDALFGREYNEALVHQVVTAYQANARRGTRAQKARGDVNKSHRKPWRQKGTGRARVGSIRTPLWRHGGTVHGPQPRDYSNHLSRGEKRNALKSALSQKLKEEKIVVLDGLDLQSHKTAALRKQLLGLGIDGKALLVDSHDNEKLHLASRNQQALKVVDALAVNVYDVVDRPYLVTSVQALSKLIEVLAR